MATKDSFQLARSLYNRRKSLFAKAADLLEAADPKVRALVEAQEIAEADQPIALTPTESTAPPS